MSAAGTGNDPHDDADDVDARFAELVASLDDVEDLDTSADDDARDEPRAGSGPGLTYPVAPWVAVGPRDWDGTSQFDDAERGSRAGRVRAPGPGRVMGTRCDDGAARRRRPLGWLRCSSSGARRRVIFRLRIVCLRPRH